MIVGISVIKPEMSLQRLDLVLFYSLLISVLVNLRSGNNRKECSCQDSRSDITDCSEIFLRLDIVVTSSVTDVVLQRLMTR